eukprot:jgi/Botrbrau1/16373/Bobra.0245s0005.1
MACTSISLGISPRSLANSSHRKSVSPRLPLPLKNPKGKVPGNRFNPRIRAATDTDKEVDVEAILKDLQSKWDGVENKTSVIVYGVGAIVLVWLSSTIVGAVNAVPLLPKILELVGLGYSAWFVYRYLLFKSSREELLQDVDDLKKKISS